MKTTRFSVTLDAIATVPVVDLAQRFGTPLYVYDAARIDERIDDLRAFDVIRFAQKACSNLTILEFIRGHGAAVDSVSAGEIRRAMAAGFRPGTGETAGQSPEIVYTADIFDREALDLVVDHKIPVNCGSPDMIDQLGKRVPGRSITLRINPGFGHGHSQKTNTGGEGSKHGIWHEQIGECVVRANKYDLTVDGLHMHIGSGTDFEHLSQVCGAMEKAARTVGPSVRTISAGGGLPVPYHDGEEFINIPRYFEIWDQTRRRLANEFGHSISLEIEPGRYLTAESGYLIAEIFAVKRMGTKLYYVVDAGFNTLARPILYGAYHPLAVAAGNGRPPMAARQTHGVVVAGPLCESGDIFTQEEGGFVTTRELPEAAVGDYLVIQNAGAYCFCMSSNYNSKPFAAEVLIEAGQPRVIRRRQTFDEMIAGEVAADSR